MKKQSIVILGAVLVAVLVGLRVKNRPTEAAPPTGEPPIPAAADPSPRVTVPLSPSGLVVAPSSPANALPPGKNFFHRVNQGDAGLFKLAPEQIQAHLERNRTNAESLLAAFNATSDKALLREAASRFPSNALVLSTVLAHDALPERRQELLEQFKRMAPDNSLPNYLAARDHARAGQTDLALAEFEDAGSKSGFQDYTVERIQGLEDLYLGAGYSPVEAKALAMASVQMPTLGQMRDLGRDLAAIEKQYVAGGDTTSAQALARMGVGMAGNLNGPNATSLLGQLVGNYIERGFLNGLDPSAPPDFLSQSIDDRMAQLRAQETSLRESAGFFDSWMESATDAQRVGYFDRLRLYGETAALDWAKVQGGHVP